MTCGMRSVTPIILYVLILTGIACSANKQTDLLQPAPPRQLYHFGPKEALLENANQNTIPEGKWQDFIMGKKSRFNLPPFLRGLYGTSQASYAAFFGDRLLGTKRAPWFMVFSLKDSCLTPERVAAISLLPQQPQFITWLTSPANSSKLKTIKSFRKQCMKKNQDGQFWVKTKQLSNHKGVCEILLAKYFEDHNIAIVFDEVWPNPDRIDQNYSSAPVSWFVRDRSCITAVDGDVTDELKHMTSNPDLWNTIIENSWSHSKNVVPVPNTSLLVILVSALNDWHDNNITIPENLLTALTSKPTSLQFDIHQHSIWLKETAAHIVRNFIACHKKGKQESFQRAAKVFLNATEQASFIQPTSFETAFVKLRQDLNTECASEVQN